MKKTSRRIVSLLSSVVLVAGIFAPQGVFAAGAAGKIGTLSSMGLKYYDEAEYTGGNEVLKFPAGVTGTGPNEFFEAGELEQKSRVTGAFGKVGDDASFRIRTTPDVVAPKNSKNLEFSAGSGVPGLGSKTYYTFDAGNTLVLTTDVASSTINSTGDAEKDIMAGVTLSGGDKWPKFVQLNNGKFAFQNSSVTADFDVNTWYNVALEITSDGSKCTYSVWIDGEKVVSDVEVWSGMLGLRTINLGHLVIKKNGVIADLYVDNPAMYINEAYTPERYKSNKDAADLSFTRDMAGANADAAYVWTDVILPSEGAQGSTITWTSDKESVINSTTGSVLRQATDTDVKLTATITNGTGPAARTNTKEFAVTVKGTNFDRAAYANAAEQNLTANTDFAVPTAVDGNFTFETDVKIGAANAAPATLSLLGTDGTAVSSVSLGADSMGASYTRNEIQSAGIQVTGSELPGLGEGWHNLKLYADLGEKNYDLYLDNLLAAEDVFFTDDQAEDLKTIRFSAGSGTTDYSIKNMAVTYGRNGLFFKPAVVVDAAGDPVASLSAGTPVTARFTALNASGAPLTFQKIVWQGDAYASEECTLPANELWTDFDKSVTPKTATDNIKIMLWKDMDSVVPLTKSGGFIGSPVEKESAKAVLIGDSTVNYGSTATGWGQVFQPRFEDTLMVVNEGRSGRSTRSYLASGRLDRIAGYVTEGDYVFFQLAHNDRSAGFKRTDASSSYKEYVRQYVARLRQKGAHIIFVTPPCLKGDVTGSADSTLLPYANAMKEVAQECAIPVVDLFTGSLTKFKAMETETVGAVESIYGVKKDGAQAADATHFTDAGAELLADIIIAELQEQNLSIAKFIK